MKQIKTSLKKSVFSFLKTLFPTHINLLKSDDYFLNSYHTKEIFSFSEIDPKSFCHDTLVVTDINDTVISGDEALWQKATLNSLRGKPAQKLSMLSPERKNLLANLMMQKCFNNEIGHSSKFFKTLKEKKIPSLALSAAFAEALDGVSMAELVTKELSREGLSFLGPLKGEKIFTELTKDPISKAYPILLKEGILLTNGNSNPKGPVLKAYLDSLDISKKPKRIVFFDDSPSNLQSVLETICPNTYSLETYQVKAAPQGLSYPSERDLKLWESLIDRSRLEIPRN